jgi:class 3 adenylate cyclase
MPKLSASQRAKLPDRAFAYVDAHGKRRLPIHDEAHVRNALARFERVSFEDDAARERARKRLLNAAKKYGIVPVGFITGQLQVERRARSNAPPLPTGSLTLLLTDIEGSTALLRQLGDAYADLLTDIRGIIRDAVIGVGGYEVDARADEFFAVFEQVAAAIQAAVAMQRTLGERSWLDDVIVRVRAGLHSGRPKLTETGYVGLSVHTAARVCSVGHGGQIVMSARTKAIAEGSMPDGVTLHDLGQHRLRGLANQESLFQVGAEGLLDTFPPLRTGP